MHTITLECETDFDGWRKAARALALSDVKPSDVTWTVRGHAPSALLPEPPQGSFNVPAKFLALAQSAILHRDHERFALLYRLLWRLRGDHDLLTHASDPDAARLIMMAKAVHRDQQRMQASLRFREIGREQKSHFVAWFEPEHHIVQASAPFFASRFADMPWSILTPDVCAHWDGHAVLITSGISKAEAPKEDRLEETWRRTYASIFNPARLKVKAMQTEMPQRHWRNPPEASLIEPLIENAEKRQEFEFVNGFHDTANAVATVIYTHSLPAEFAVMWSGFFNFLGVLLSSGAVAFGIVSLLPVELILQVGTTAGFAMIFALLIAYPWVVLTIGTICYLASLPFGFLSYRKYERRSAALSQPGAAAAAMASGTATVREAPAASPARSIEHPANPERPTRLN
jgi:probable DNA metabolism protein